MLMKEKQEDKDWSLYMTSLHPLHLLGFAGHAHFLLAPFPGFRALAWLHASFSMIFVKVSVVPKACSTLCTLVAQILPRFILPTLEIYFFGRSYLLSLFSTRVGAQFPSLP